MAAIKIAQIGDPILAKRANPVQVTQIKNKAVQKLIDDMIQTLKGQKAAGISAPQIGESKRIIVLNYMPRKNSLRKVRIPLRVMINPIILKKSEDKELDWESCLSVNLGDIRGVVPRYKRMEIQGFDRKGKKFTQMISGFKLRIIQHELDHLEGKLFFERMRKRDLSSLANHEEWLKHHRPKWRKPAAL